MYSHTVSTSHCGCRDGRPCTCGDCKCVDCACTACRKPAGMATEPVTARGHDDAPSLRTKGA